MIHESGPEVGDRMATRGRWIYLVALAVGAASGAFILACMKHYVDGRTGKIGGYTLCMTPFLLGVLAGRTRPDRPIRVGLLMTAVALVAGLPLLGEGAICVLVISPVYLLVGALTAGITGAIVRERRRLSLFGIVVLLLPAPGAWLEARLLDGSRPVVTIADSVAIDAPREAVWGAVSRLTLRIPERPVTDLGSIVAAMLPRPMALVGGGIERGDVRRVVFDNGTLLATVARSERFRRFTVDLRVEQAGREFFDHWANLMDATFTFDELPGNRTLVTHATRYEPRCFPRWYFEPLERLFARKVQAFLLDEFVRQRFTGPAPGKALAVR
jgi:hypothetical protein